MTIFSTLCPPSLDVVNETLNLSSNHAAVFFFHALLKSSWKSVLKCITANSKNLFWNFFDLWILSLPLQKKTMFLNLFWWLFLCVCILQVISADLKRFETFWSSRSTLLISSSMVGLFSPFNAYAAVIQFLWTFWQLCLSWPFLLPMNESFPFLSVIRSKWPEHTKFLSSLKSGLR